MRISELERRTGVSQRLLRYYEEQGLLRPERLPSGYRVYAEGDVTTVEHIRNLLAAGLSTSTIADLLPCMASADGRLIADCPELLVDLHRERARLSAAIIELTTARSTLDQVIATAPPSVEHAATRLLDAG
ncbi:MerR family transcriptional regulator [Amycolatopsis pittospori]|uniref:MerR family transcriptional regulator n=1 Tax=Amycolatopsis pittospori TaxID=2749434 RepID=UPI0015F0916B|nr:MerR family transcriptional regulator [Amycolatopsis pittospori]